MKDKQPIIEEWHTCGMTLSLEALFHLKFQWLLYIGAYFQNFTVHPWQTLGKPWAVLEWLIMGSAYPGVANGRSKTIGLAKVLPNFMGLAVSFLFSSCVHLTVLIFFKAKKVAKYRFVYFFFVKFNDITTS